jgi:hypothetical protein
MMDGNALVIVPPNATRVLPVRALIAETMNAGNIETILHSYPLSKLFIELMDAGTIDLNRGRVNTVHVEEWNYVNPAADEEFNQVGRQ